MKNSPIYPKYEAGDYSSYEFDPQVDFVQFLKEARTHACEENFDIAPQNAEAPGNKPLGGGPKNKKSWKSSLFSWMKADRKSKTTMEPSNTSTYNISKPRRGYFSGPIHGSVNGITDRPRRPTTGPLTGLFNSTKRVEGDVPYLCLDRLNNQSYGPVYLVT